jgi:hypothetical protein
MIKIIKDEPQVKPIRAEITQLVGWLKSSRHGGSLVVPADNGGRYARVPGSKAARKENLQRLEELFSRIGLDQTLAAGVAGGRLSMEKAVKRSRSPYVRVVKDPLRVTYKPKLRSSPASHVFTLSQRLPGSFEAKNRGK